MGKLEKTIISTLDSFKEGLTLIEIAEKVGESKKKVFRELRKLFNKGKIVSENRRYRLSES